MQVGDGDKRDGREGKKGEERRGGEGSTGDPMCIFNIFLRTAYAVTGVIDCSCSG